MKIISRIILILLVASVVAGAFSFAVNNSSTTSNSNDGGQPPAITISNDQSTMQPVERPENGDRDGGSLTGGLAGVLGTFAKLTGITVMVLLIQKAFSLFGNRKLIPAQN